MFTLCVIGVGLLLNVYIVMEYKVDLPYSMSDQNPPYNAYDIVYCGDSRRRLAPTFLLRCKIFPILNLINSVLNNIVYLCVGVLIDILLILFTNANLKHKKNLTNDVNILNEAVNFKVKVNKMIIVNGILYFVSHLPQFVITVAFFVLKKQLAGFCYFYFLCDDFLEILQTSSLISISFSFFIYLKFDNNIRGSYADIMKKMKSK